MSALLDARRNGGVVGVRALLTETFARCVTAAEACDALGMTRTPVRGRTQAPTSSLRRAALRAGVPWPYTSRGRPRAAECAHPHVPVPAFDADAARHLSADEVRARWPRGNSQCPGCGARVISYASPLHYVSGDW